MICRLCLNTLDEQNAVLLFASAAAAAASECNNSSDNNKQIPENYLVHLISTHLYLCVSPTCAATIHLFPSPALIRSVFPSCHATMPSPRPFAQIAVRNSRVSTTSGSWWN